MTIIDDLKAINKDIERTRKFREQIARYWIIKLKNIYPDYNFLILYDNDFNIKIVGSIKEVI